MALPGFAERFEVERTIAADAATHLPGAVRPAGPRGDRQLRDAAVGRRRAGDRGRRHVRRPHGPRGAQRLSARPVRRDRHDHDVRAGPRDRLDDPRPDPAADRPRLRLPARAGRTAARSSPRTTTGRRSTRCGGTANIFPIIPEGALRATLGILARTVAGARETSASTAAASSSSSPSVASWSSSEPPSLACNVVMPRAR